MRKFLDEAGLTLLWEKIKKFSMSTTQKGVFSWHMEDLTVNYETMAKMCNLLDLTEVFQSFTWNSLNSAVATAITYVQNNTKNNVNISYLAGDPYWYNTTDMSAHLAKVIEYNNGIGTNAKIEKIIMDVEPWVLDLEMSEWVDVYLTTMQNFYQECITNNIKLGLVIPYWLDSSTTINSETFYKNVIDCCDEVYVMNYKRKDVIEHINKELLYCQATDKPIYHISECQEINEENGVTESLTYYNVGLRQLRIDWEEMKNTFLYSNLHFAYHDFNAMLALLPILRETTGGDSPENGGGEDVPETTNLYYQDEDKTGGSSTSGYTYIFGVDKTITFDSIDAALTVDKDKDSANFNLSLVADTTYKVAFTYVSGTCSLGDGNTGIINFYIGDNSSGTLTKLESSTVMNNIADIEFTFTASETATIAARVGFYAYAGNIYDNLKYSISITEVTA